MHPISSLEHYTSIIQLVTGINFAFILANFTEKAGKISTMDKTLEETCCNINKRFATEFETADSVDAVKEKAKLTRMNNRWLSREIFLQRIRQPLVNFDTRAIFFLNSLYCIVDLIMIAVCVQENKSFSAFLFVFNYAIFLTNIVYLIISFVRSSRSSKTRQQVHSNALFFFLLNLIGSYGIHFSIHCSPKSAFLHYSCYYLSVIIPFIPLFSASLFILTDMVLSLFIKSFQRVYGARIYLLHFFSGRLRRATRKARKRTRRQPR